MTINVTIVGAKNAVSFTAPAKFEERNYNPCYDTIIVPDFDSPDCPETLKRYAGEIVGPMQSDKRVIDGTPYRVMGRFETAEAYEMYSK